MHLGIPINVSAEGSFVIEKRNIETNEVWHYASNNVCLPSINRILRYVSAYYNGRSSLFTPDTCKCQFGSGTVEPTVSDTALGHVLWTIGTSTLVGHVSDDGTKFISTFTFVIPATSSYVGNITELGLRYYYRYSYTNSDALMTHSLLKDAEGNPYTIQKTDLDQITVTYTVTLTFSNPSVMPAMAWANTNANEIYAVTSAFGGNVSEDKCALTLDCRRRKIFAGDKCVLVPYENGNLSVINNKISLYDGSFNSTNIVTLPVKRVGLSHVLNGHFINALTIIKDGGQSSDAIRVEHKTRYNPLAIITLPDATLFPTYTLRDYSVGTGDGAVQDFTPPIPMWLAGTEQIYVDSLLQVNGVDYTCDNLHNLRKNLELTPMYQASIIDGIKTAVDKPYIDRIYISDKSEINTGGANTILMTRVYETATPHTYSVLKLDNTHPFIIELDDTFDTRIDEIYLWTYYAANDQAAQYDIVTIEASSDSVNWDLVLDRVAGADANHGTSNYPYSTTLTAGWKKYTLPSTVNKKYWKVSVAMAGATDYHNRFGLVMMHAGQPIHFNTAPADGAVITMNCDIDRPYKDSNHVLDTSATMTL